MVYVFIPNCIEAFPGFSAYFLWVKCSQLRGRGWSLGWQQRAPVRPRKARPSDLCKPCLQVLPGRLAETLGLKPVEKKMARGIRCPRISSKTTSSQYLGQLVTPSCALTATSHRPPCFTGVWCAGSVTIVRPPALKCTALLKRLETHQKNKNSNKKPSPLIMPGADTVARRSPRINVPAGN